MDGEERIIISTSNSHTTVPPVTAPLLPLPAPPPLPSPALTSTLHAAAAQHPPPPPPPAAAVVFDFDFSLVNDNTDTFVLDVLAPDLRAVVRQGYATGRPWTSLMDDALLALAARGHGAEALAAALHRIPVDAAMLTALRTAAAARLPVFIVSDANSYYIDVLLTHLGLAEAVTGVVTNPVWHDDEGRLRVAPYVLPSSPHGCPRCPPNMCKRAILRDVLGLVSGGASSSCPRVLYVGDGSGDVCPALALGPGSVVCARAGYPMHKALLDAAADAAAAGGACVASAGGGGSSSDTGGGVSSDTAVANVTGVGAAAAFAATLVPWADGAAVLAAVEAFVQA